MPKTDSSYLQTSKWNTKPWGAQNSRVSSDTASLTDDDFSYDHSVRLCLGSYECLICSRDPPTVCVPPSGTVKIRRVSLPWKRFGEQCTGSGAVDNNIYPSHSQSLPDQIRSINPSSFIALTFIHERRRHIAGGKRGKPGLDVQLLPPH